MEGDKLKKDIPRRPTGVFYIERERGYYFEETLASPLSLDFTIEAVSDLEIVSKKKLETLIQTFVNTNRLVPKSIIILLSTSITFENEFADTTLELEKKIDEFFELVPFENYISKHAKFPGKIKIVAVNKDLCDTVKNAFSSLGFGIAGIYPLSFYLEVAPSLQTNLDLGLVINKSPELRNFNLLSDSQLPGNSPKKEKKDNKRLYILGGTFAILMVILLFVVYRFIILPPKQPKSLPVKTPAPKPTVIQEASPSGEFKTEQINSTPSANTQNTEAI